MSSLLPLVSTALLLVSACAPSDTAPAVARSPARPGSTTTTPPERNEHREVLRHRFTVDIGADGWSDPVEVEIPPGTRSMGITVSGAFSDIIALAELSLADGADRVRLQEPVRPLLEALGVQHVRLMPGGLHQEAGRGTFAFVYPATGAAELPAGPARIRLASTGIEAEVDVVLPPDDGSAVLPVDVFVVGGAVARMQAASPELQRAAELVSQAGIELRWEVMGSLDVPEAVEIDVDTVSEPDGPLARFVAAARPLGTEALDVFILPELGRGMDGVSPTIPGPLPPHPLAAVLLEMERRPSDTGRVLAHEVAHFLGLHHVETHTDDGRTVPDPLLDTEHGENNLMEMGTVVSPEQAEVLRRSPLLVSR